MTHQYQNPATEEAILYLEDICRILSEIDVDYARDRVMERHGKAVVKEMADLGYWNHQEENPDTDL